MSKNKYIWSLDLSTTNVGAALWDNKGELVELKHLKLKVSTKVNVEDRFIYKANTFKEYVMMFKQRINNEFDGEIISVVIEEPLGGSNNLKTVATLFEFNGICRYIIYEILGIIPIKISVHESRKAFFPEFVFNKKVKGEITQVLSFPNTVEWKETKKLMIWKKVASIYPNIDWILNDDGTPKDMCFDMSDSIVVGVAGLKLLNIL